MRRFHPRLCLIWLTLCLSTAAAQAATVSVAVASNFTLPMREIAHAFHAQTGINTRIAYGSSGNFYAQIRHGAPFQVFLSADEAKPEKLAAAGLIVPGSRFTYAVGGLVLWSSQPGLVDAHGDILLGDKFNKLSIANPQLAPYGAAAVQVLQRLHRFKALKHKFVIGENIAQAYQFVMTGNAELGFVARSQVTRKGKLTRGSAWLVPEDLHSPIRQDAVLLKSGKDMPAAIAFLHFLKGSEARAIIKRYGYR